MNNLNNDPDADDSGPEFDAGDFKQALYVCDRFKHKF